MNQTPPIWHRLLLHAALLGGSVIFALPFVWLVGTSWKLDKEIQSEQIQIFPQSPAPNTRSPYVDKRTFVFERPDGVGRHRWNGWMRPTLEREIGDAVDKWVDDRTESLDPSALRGQLIAGVFQRLRELLPVEAWSAPENEFRSIVAKAVNPGLIVEAFDQCYRYLALGKVLLKDRHYQIHDLTSGIAIEDLWQLESGGLMQIESRMEAGRSVAVCHYDFDSDDSFAVTAMLPLSVKFEEFRRLDVSFRRDQTWHELRAEIEVGGTLFRSRSPKYLGEDTWWDVQFQLPGPDDERLIPHRYVLIDAIDEGSRYDHGDDRMKLRIIVSRSSQSEAYWAKGTENYRKVFDEVPFWRYLSTSAFLAIANILGACLSCSLAAFAFARLRWPGRTFCFGLVLATLMIPPQVTMIPSFVIYKQLGWYNTLAPLWVPSCLAVNAFAIFLLRQAMKGIPRDLEDAARIDGCGYLRVYWHVALPLMRPTLAAISVFTFMYVWNDFMGPLIYVNDQSQYPLALGLFGFMAGRENQFTLIMAGATVMTLPVILTFFFLQRYFIQGVALTGMKN